MESSPSRPVPSAAARRWRIGAALVPLALVVVLRGLNQAGQLGGGPLQHWPAQLAAVGAALAAYGVFYWLLRSPSGK
jgi:hypothetical protein